ncbi:monovalent cation/H+ antiporter complex subunit F [Homoserinibacter sp. YIM 151385]|uniref:monovalent cation/H+ antiporter complex subunit F n=1 Tax=Homoserinibacter sp. YIM 151385 TaxID=2985506 RepID=UPI0022F0CFD7|nr:monovalent cation/H+ antiporter complex subunit F [Homoserinibacter sp. YIM 151385]WBU39287.1 monovalent cation/H+ antiporter complex subunit F [Homoserinibacter sp. YIM 151385]
MTVLHWIAGALFAATGLLAVFRVVRGPSILDRMIASDVLLTCLMLIVGMEMVVNHHTRSIPLMLVLAASAIFGTVAVARYVSKQDRGIQGGGGS